MKVLIFGGTSEARLLINKLTKLDLDLSVSVTTSQGVKMLANQAKQITIIVGRKEKDQLQDLIAHYDYVIDATHPYATLITQQLKEITEEYNIPYLRLKREYYALDNALIFSDFIDVVDYLNKHDGNALITTGSKNIQTFLAVNDYQSRLFFRVLPIKETMVKLFDYDINAKNIIGMQGPFSKELNEAMIKQVNAKYLVTKDSGINGGIVAKIESCKELNIKLLVINNQMKTGKSIHEIEEYFKEKL